jgi:XamI restriction endonuclease
VVIQPKKLRESRLPIMIEAKSAGDFTNVNKRRKEEAKKMARLKGQFGDKVEYVLFLCGYFNAGYLGYEAADGMDWIWEHRVKDLDKLGL